MRKRYLGGRSLLIAAVVAGLGVVAGCASDGSRLSDSLTKVNRAGTGSGIALNSGEIAVLRALFGATLDPAPIRLVSNSLGGIGSSRTVENTIYLEGGKDMGDKAFRASDEALRIVVHESSHVWQYQNVGLRYLPDSLYDQSKSRVSHGDRRQAYRYTLEAPKKLSAYGTEQQAKLIEEYAMLKLLGRMPGACENIAALGAERFTTVVEALMVRDVNPQFRPLDRTALMAALGRR